MPHDHPTVLVAVPDTDLRNVLVQSLRRDDYLVLEAANTAAALHMARTHSRPIHVMLVHLSMGHELKSALRQYRPKIEVFFFAEPSEEQLQDVFTPETALVKIREYFNP